MKEPINWKLFWILLGGSILGVIAAIPYILTLQADFLGELPLPLHILLPAQILQNAVIFAILIFVGLCLAGRVGLGAPILEGWLEGMEVRAHLKSILAFSAALGVSAGLLIMGFDFLLSFFAGPIMSQVPHPPIWQGFLASFYGGISEEVMMRLFLMSLLVWISYKIKRTREGKPTDLGVWLAIVLTAIIFGLGHLPITAQLTQITALVVARAIILNGIGGMFFGWLYWRKGLESAMISHFSADITLLVVFPFFV